MKKAWYSCLKEMKEELEIKGEHIGAGEMLRLILLPHESFKYSYIR
jgi:hypothetical protein